MTEKLFYKMKLYADECGLRVKTIEYACIHETKCVYFVVEKSWSRRLRAMCRGGDLTPVQWARKHKPKAVKQIHKRHSRIAFETKDKALEHLRFLKRKQLNHMKRDIQFVEAFLDCEDLEPPPGTNILEVPNTRDLVHSHYIFDI